MTSEEDRVSSILILGGPGEGKTIYGAQLLGRLNENQGLLAMRGAPVNIHAFEEALRRLNQGQPPSHTRVDTYDEIRMPIKSVRGYHSDLVWPDYGGEQVDQLLDQRHIPPDWRHRIERSDGWLLFVRPDRIQVRDDILSRPRSDEEGRNDLSDSSTSPWSEQARLIELMQLMLFAKGLGPRARVQAPALTIMLSCWDELNGEEGEALPRDVFRARVPLFADFVESVWATDPLSVFGLSSLGKALDVKSSDQAYRDQGPERFGYVILPNGTRSSDLTLPVAALTERMV